jgi:hypothetical protein
MDHQEKDRPADGEAVVFNPLEGLLREGSFENLTSVQHIEAIRLTRRRS